MFVDAFGRTITYLRISVTDRCNLRCVYCMPRAGLQWQPLSEQLSVDEIERVVKAAAKGGVRRVRLTGGEPLVHPQIIEMVRRIAALPGIEEVSLTTNGMLLERLAQPLADAGLRRVNVSLDTLDAERFRRITRVGEINRVWNGIAAAAQAGLTPLKLNTVVVRGLNDGELTSLARLTVENPWHIRFIEIMPVGNVQEWGDGFPAPDRRYVSVQEMHSLLAGLRLEPAAAPLGNGPARTFRIPGALGTVGFISPLGEHFCATCNRLRLTSDGKLRPCLGASQEVPLREALRLGQPLDPYFYQALANKPREHGFGMAVPPPSGRHMSQIGG